MPGLMFTVGANNAQAIAAFSQTLAAANAQGKIITQTLDSAAGGQRHWNGVIREGLVLLREISRGNWTRVPGSLSLFVQRLNDQLPFLRALLNPVTLAIGAMTAAVAVCFVETYKWFHGLAQGQETLSKITGGNVSTAFNYIADAIEKCAVKTQEFNDWLGHLRDSMNNDSIDKVTDRKLEALREEFEWQQKIAQKKGQTPQQGFQAKIEEMKKEKAVVDEANQKAFDNTFAANVAAKKANTEANDPERLAKIEDLKRRKEAAKKVVDEVAVEYNKSTGLNAFEEEKSPFQRGFSQPYETKESGTISPGDAFNTYNTITKQLTTYEIVQKSKEDAAATTKSKSEKSQEASNSLNEKANALDRKLKLTEKYGPQLADEGKRQVVRGRVNALQAIGAYTPPSQVTMVDIAKRSEKHLAAIAKAVAKGGGSGGKKGTF